MGEALDLRAIFFSTMAGGAIVLTGALYSLFFALAHLHSSRWMNAASLLAYTLLVAAVVVLIDSLALEGFWLVVAATMVVGYFFLPRAIWHLCVGTHAGDTAATESGATQ